LSAHQLLQVGLEDTDSQAIGAIPVKFLLSGIPYLGKS